MRFVFYTNSVSPHQLPLARELVRRLGADNYRYVAKAKLPPSRLACGWKEVSEPWISYGEYGKDAVTDEMLETCDVLLTGERCLGLFEKRAENGLKTLYYSERWFKPIHGVTGRLRMLVPSFRRMAKRFVSIVNTNPDMMVLPVGVHAKKDMEALGVSSEKMMMWGYFVEPSSLNGGRAAHDDGELKVICVGRLVRLKHFDTVIRAVIKANSICPTRSVTLTIIGDGPEKCRLVKLAERLSPKSPVVSFLPAQPIDEVRRLIRDYDVLVFASDGRDGWGAVVNEALEEGIAAVGTYETGASATILPESNLFHAGDYNALAVILCGSFVKNGIGEWSAAEGAEKLLAGIR